MRRPTIADIARRAGVTKAAVSFALNGHPGLSAAAHERMLAIAAEIGFQPNSAARALSDGRAGAVGLVIDRPARTLGSEVFFMQLISGIQGELALHHVTLLFTMAEDQAEEIRLYRSWWAQRKVDGVFVVDLQVRDRRIRVLEELTMPAVVLGAPRGAGTLPAVWQDDEAATRTVIGYLAGLGHRRIARIGGFPRYWHSKLRTDALAEVAGAAGIQAFSVAADYTAEHGAEATRDLLKQAEPPTAILYDNDVMALAGLGAAQRMGVRVPADLSIMVWDDTTLCELVHPALPALRPHRPARGGSPRARIPPPARRGRPADHPPGGPPRPAAARQPRRRAGSHRPS